jgi:hypothetical protein
MCELFVLCSTTMRVFGRKIAGAARKITGSGLSRSRAGSRAPRSHDYTHSPLEEDDGVQQEVPQGEASHEEQAQPQVAEKELIIPYLHTN